MDPMPVLPPLRFLGGRNIIFALSFVFDREGHWRECIPCVWRRPWTTSCWKMGWRVSVRGAWLAELLSHCTMRVTPGCHDRDSSISFLFRTLVRLMAGFSVFKYITLNSSDEIITHMITITFFYIKCFPNLPYAPSTLYYQILVLTLYWYKFYSFNIICHVLLNWILFICSWLNKILAPAA